MLLTAAASRRQRLLDFASFLQIRHLQRSRLMVSTLPSCSSLPFSCIRRTVSPMTDMTRTTTTSKTRASHVLDGRRPMTTASLACSFTDPSIGYNIKMSMCTFSSAAATAPETNSTATIPFLLADIGEGIQEVEILTWYCQPGDTIQQFDRVCEVQSDKATVEITSRYDGVVAALGANVGEIVKVGTPLMYFVTSNDKKEQRSSSAKTPATTPARPATVTAASASSSGTTTPFQQQQQLHLLKDDSRLHIPSVATHYHDSSPTSPPRSAQTLFSGEDYERKKFYASPAVRKLGAEYGLDLSTIHGSGPSGRLLKIDVLTYLKEQHGITVSSPSLSKQEYEAAQEGKATTTEGGAYLATPIKSTRDEAVLPSPTPIQSQQPEQLLQQRHDYLIPIRGYNRHMISTMTASLQIPHMGFCDELTVDAIQDFRRKQVLSGSKHVANNNKQLSIVVCMVKALSLALTHHPVLNAVFQQDDDSKHETMNSTNGGSSVMTKSSSFAICCKAQHNIGIAMDTPRGLVVPVIKSVQDKTILELQDELDRLKDAARTNKLSTFDVSDVTFTISNIGATGAGGTYMTPLLVPPQVAMGAFGSIQRVPRFDENDNVVPRHIMAVSWVADHRVLDGASLARFHGTFKDYIENPMKMLLHLK